MRKLCCLFVSLILISCSSGNGLDQTLHDKCLYPVVKVIHAKSTGSGVIVQSIKMADGQYRNVFLTCAHVVSLPGDYNLEIFAYNGSALKSSKFVPCAIYVRNAESDLAIGVFTSDNEMPVAEIATNAVLSIGADVFRIGCGLGDEPRLDYGKITSINMRGRNGSMRTSIFTVPGDSGSPVFYDNKIVGIMRAIRALRGDPIYNISLASPVTMLFSWSKENNGAYDFVWKNGPMPLMPFYQLEWRTDWIVSLR